MNRLLRMVTGAAFAIGGAAVGESIDPAFDPWVHRVEVLEGSQTERTHPWNIVSATSLPREGPPQPEWRDFARVDEPSLLAASASPDRSSQSSVRGPLADSDFRVDDRGNEVPAFWEAILPATYTLEFATPFLLHQIDLASPLRRIGFSDFRISIRGVEGESYHSPVIREATTARGPTVEAGLLWSFRIEPERIRGLRIDFERGTLDFPDRVFLKDLDLWGER